MENKLDDNTLLFCEHSDTSGFIVRELAKTKNEGMRYQVGSYAFRPMRMPVFAPKSNPPVITHHIDGDDVRVFHLLGYGPTLDHALLGASKSMTNQSATRAQNNRMLNELTGTI